MESNWQQPPFQGYAPTPYYDASRDRPQSTDPDAESQRRNPASNNGGSTFLPPPPPHTATPSSGHMALPPFSQAFYTSPSSHAYSQPGSGQSGMSFPPGGHYSSLPAYHGNYPLASPVGAMAPPLPRSYDASPRLNHTGPTGYSSSPNIAGPRHLSPTSPTTHLNMPGASTGSASSSSFPSVQKSSYNLSKGKRRSKSASQEDEWDEDGRYKSAGSRNAGLESDDMPWGMPQSEYKALNPRDKKQVRNRIGARRFRAKRKDYVSNIEASLQIRDDENAQLRQSLEAERKENNELRSRLGMPPSDRQLPPPPAVLHHNDNDNEGGLGLVVGSGDWEERKEG